MNISQKTTDGAFDLEVDELIVNETSDFKKDATYEEDLLLKGNEFTLTIGSSYLLDASIPFIFPPTIGGGGNALLTDGFGNTSWGTTVSYVAISVPPQFTINGGSSASTTTSATFNIELNNPTGTGKFVLNTNPTINTPTFVNDSTFLGNIIIEDGALTSISYMVLSRKKISFDIEVLGLSTTLAYTGLNSSSTAFEITSSVPFIFTAESTFIFNTGAINWTTGVITYEAPISFIAPLASAFSITTAGGLIEMITGLGSIGLNAEFGGITLSSLEGGIVLNTSIGVISLSTEIGAIALTTGAGALALTTAAGFITLTTGAGGIEINTGIGVGLLSGTGVSVNCVFGDIGMTSQVGNVNIRSSTGALQLFGGGGGVNIGTSSSDAVGHLIVHARNGSTAPQTGSIEFYTHDNGIFTGAGDFYVNTTEAQIGNWLMAIKGECRIANSTQFKIDYLSPIGSEDKCIQVSGVDGYFKSIQNTGTGDNVLATSPTLSNAISTTSTNSAYALSAKSTVAVSHGTFSLQSASLNNSASATMFLGKSETTNNGMYLSWNNVTTGSAVNYYSLQVVGQSSSMDFAAGITYHQVKSIFVSDVQINSLTASTAVALNGSKQLISVTNTGTGNNVLSTSPTITTPTIVDRITMDGTNTYIFSNAAKALWFNPSYGLVVNTSVSAFSSTQTVGNNANTILAFWVNRRSHGEQLGYSAGFFQNNTGRIITCTVSYTAKRNTNGFGITAFWIEPTFNTDRYAANDVAALDKASGSCTLILNPSDGFFLYTFQNSGANADYSAGDQFLSYFFF